jgi:SAM-dependent methyltransferase
MDPAHLEDMIRQENTYWWHVAKRELVRGLVARRFPPPGALVEGGVGAGGNLLLFQSLGYETRGFDMLEASVEHVRARGARVDVHDLDQPWPVADGSTRVVLLLDVVEHVADPVATLRNAKRVLAPGGGVIVTVPAYQWLYSPWDRALGHRERYTVRLLRRHAEAAGLKLTWWSHWNSFTLPPAILMRLKERLFGSRSAAEMPKVSPMVNSMLLTAAAAERAMIRLIRVPFGLSIAGVLTP